MNQADERDPRSQVERMQELREAHERAMIALHNWRNGLPIAP